MFLPQRGSSPWSGGCRGCRRKRKLSLPEPPGWSLRGSVLLRSGSPPESLSGSGEERKLNIESVEKGVSPSREGRDTVEKVFTPAGGYIFIYKKMKHNHLLPRRGEKELRNFLRLEPEGENSPENKLVSPRRGRIFSPSRPEGGGEILFCII